LLINTEIHCKAVVSEVTLVKQPGASQTVVPPWLQEHASGLLHVLISGAVVLAVTLVGLFVIGREDVTNVVLIYLFAIAAVSIRLGHRAAITAALGSALALDYYFLAPYNSFALASGREIVTFAGMFITAVFLSAIQERLRKQARAARQSERRMESLYTLARELVDATSVDILCMRAATQIEVAANASVAILLREGDGFSRAFRAGGATAWNVEDVGVARWAAAHLEPAGAGTRNHPNCTACYVPLVSGRGCVGVLSLHAREGEPGTVVAPRPSSLVSSMARQVALALDRALLSEEKQRAIVEAETERIRNAVLSSVSHDLRTPLAVITSASSALLEHGDRIPSASRAEMCRMIHDEGRRLNDLLKSLLDVTRLQGGNFQVSRDWESMEEVIGSVLRRIEEQTIDRHVRANVPSDLPLLQIDATLVEQVILNLVDNAFKHSLSEQSVDVDVAVRDESVLVSVIDHGRGVRADELDHIFDKFYRNEAVISGGLGLGLTIARGIVQAHGGRIWATHTPGGGLTIHFTLPLPLGGSPPGLLGIEAMEEGARQEPA
jgi:two-component system sensor histidine kinase KdpD